MLPLLIFLYLLSNATTTTNPPGTIFDPNTTTRTTSLNAWIGVLVAFVLIFVKRHHFTISPFALLNPLSIISLLYNNHVHAINITRILKIKASRSSGDSYLDLDEEDDPLHFTHTTTDTDTDTVPAAEQKKDTVANTAFRTPKRALERRVRVRMPAGFVARVRPLGLRPGQAYPGMGCAVM
jgi:hypothetical protein